MELSSRIGGGRRPSGRAALIHVAKLLAVALAYYVTAKAGLALAYENSSVTAVWPPAGIALAALVLGGRKLWPGVALGALLANAWTGVPLITVLGITAGNTLAAFVGASLLVGLAAFRPSLERTRDVLALAVVAGLTTTISATVGVASLSFGDAVQGDALGSVWRIWWLGDLSGELIVAPFLMVFAGGLQISRRPGRRVEAAALLAALVGVGCFVFSSAEVRAFLIFPLLVWAALRFGPRGAAAGSLVLAGIAVGFTANEIGPYTESTPDGSLLISQAFAGVWAVVSLLLAAITTERRRAHEALGRAHAEVGDEVRERTALLRRSQAWLQDAQKLAQLGSWEWDIDADTVTWSDELYRIYGVSPAAYAPSYAGYIARVHPDDRARVEAAIRAAFADREPFAFDERIVRPDGDVRTLASRGKVFVDGEGRATRMLGACQDVTEQRRVEGALRETEERARRVVEDAHAGFVSIDASGTITDWNPRAEIIFGWSRAEAIGRKLAATIIPERYRAAHRGGLDRFLAAAGESRVTGTTIELEVLRRDGEEFPVELSLSAIPTVDGRTFNALVHDISERKQAERAIADAQERFRGAFEEAPIGMALMDLDGRFQQVNGALCEITGYSREELADTPFESITHPDDTAEIHQQMNRVRGGQSSSYKTEKRYVHASGHQIWLALQATLLRDANGEPGHLLAQLLDISDRRRYEDKLQHLADHDPLTGLLNRRSFERELESHLDRGRRYGMEGAVLLLDLDQFKYVNDSLGHHAGDDLIVRVAHALRGRLRETDVLARLGGDEFAVLLLKADLEGAQRVGRDLLAAVREQEVHAGSGGSRSVTASLGVGMIDEEDGLGAEDVMVNADLAMYDAKEAGRDRLATYSADGSAPARMKGRLTWIERIRGALEQERFTLLAQPIIDLSTGRATQHELLLRMKDETGDLIPPGAFLPIAEQFDMVQEIDRWVVRNAVSILEDHEDRGRPLTLEVNLSGRSLGNPELLDLIVAELGRARVSPERLIFEVTETAAVANMAAARGFSERLSKLGCRFALDDFGAGFGSFYYLKHLPFDFLKIDGEFVRNCCVGHTDQLLIGAVVDIARGLGKKTVAEIVGDQDTVEMLTKLGVDYAQGYHLGRPGPLEEVLGPRPHSIFTA